MHRQLVRRKLMLSVAVVPILFALTASAAVDPELPSPAPVVNSVFPHGAERGTTTTIKLSGLDLNDAQSVEFSGRGVKGEILSSLGTTVQLRVTVDGNAEV